MFRFGKKIKFCECIIFYITGKFFIDFMMLQVTDITQGHFRKKIIYKYQYVHSMGLHLKMSKKARNSVTEKMTKVRYFKHFFGFFSSDHICLEKTLL